MTRIVTPEEARKLREAATPGTWARDGLADVEGSVATFHRVGPGSLGAVRDAVILTNTQVDAELIAAARDLAYTVEQQGQQIAAAKALHPLNWSHVCLVSGSLRTYAFGEPCPTARALGVEVTIANAAVEQLGSQS